MKKPGDSSRNTAGDTVALRRRPPVAPSRSASMVQSKAELRRELEQATRQFLHRGGEVTEIATGTSAWEPGTQPPPSRPLFNQPRSERTPVTDVVATIEARREAMKKRNRKPQRKNRSQRSRRRIIYDDFGEPLRHVWVDE